MTELALTPDSRWGIGFGDLVTAAADAGFSALGAAAGSADAAAARALAGAGLRCHELLALVVTADSEVVLRQAEALAAAAAAVGAEWVLTGFAAWPPDEVISRCAAMFAEAGAKMAVEFSPLGPVPSIPAALEVAAAAGGRAGVLVDSWHFFHGPSTWDDLARIPLDRIAYVQFSDALPPAGNSSAMAETLHRRTLPGDGTLDLRRFAHVLRERGWDGLVSVEVLSAALRERLPVGEFAAAASAATARYWS